MDAQEGQGSDHKLKRIRAVGFNETYETSDMLDKLAILADGTYEGLSSDELAGEDALPVLDGTLYVNANAYEDSIETLRITFPKLVLNISGEFYLRFTDSVVGSYLFSRFGDGNGVTKKQLGQVTNSQLGNPFMNNSQIVSFEEMKYFSNIYYLDANFFLNCTSLTSVVLPPNTMSLYNACFRNTALTTIVIPKTVVYIEQSVFEECKYLETCIFEEGRTSPLKMRWSTWLKSGLKEIILPDDVIVDMNMGHTFAYCKELTKVHLPNNIPGIYDSMFRDCDKLVEVNIPATVTSLGSRAFNGCSSLTKLDCLGNIVSIEQYTFSGCSSLTWLRIPSTCTFIAKYSFERCNVLTTLIVEASTPPAIEMYSINDISDLKIYVPDRAVNVYKVATIWSQYASKIYPISSLAAMA